MSETRNQKSETRMRTRDLMMRDRSPLLVSGFWFLVSGWRALLLVSGFWFLVSACTQSTPTTAPAPPAPAPMPVAAPVAVVEPVKVPTLDELRSLRANNQLDLYEAGLKTLTQSAEPQTKGRALALLALFL